MKKQKQKRKLIAIVGGSGAGKTWLANKIEQSLGQNATRISLDNFYRDRSHLSETRRNAINFDHPRAIDWPEVERALSSLAAGKRTRLPEYDFASHSRRENGAVVESKAVIIVDGLWLLRRPSLRRLFSCAIYLECPRTLCLRRRIQRDLTERKRDSASVRKQFLEHVLPMQERFVTSQKRWADIVVKKIDQSKINDLTEQIKQSLRTN